MVAAGVAVAGASVGLAVGLQRREPETDGGNIGVSLPTVRSAR